MITWAALVLGFAAGLLFGARFRTVRTRVAAEPAAEVGGRFQSALPQGLAAADEALVDQLLGDLGIEDDGDPAGDEGDAPAAGDAPVGPEVTGEGAESPELTQGPAAVVRQRLQRVLVNLPVGIVVTDVDGRAAYRNELAEEFGSGRHTDTLVDAAIAEVAELSEESGRAMRELDLYGPPRRFLVLRGSAMFENDRYLGTVVSIEDTTENHRVADIRRDFVANVSHELKTPVGALGVLAETLVDADDPDIVQRLSNRVLAEAIRLGNTIDDLLTLSQVESGEVFDPHEVAVGDVLAMAVDRVSSAAEQRNVDVVIDADDATVLADRRQLVSALANLVDNAIKYSDEGTTVEVTARQADGWTSFEITDHGIGIPEGDLERVFERFYRVDPSRRRDTGGTGLGLSIVRNVAVAHGGEVGLRSTEGVGSTFTLRLPETLPALDLSRSSEGVRS